MDVLCQLDNITYNIGYIIGTLIGIAFRLFVFSFIITLFLRLSVRIVAKFTPKFGKALRASFAGLFLSCLALIAIRVLIVMGKIDPLQFPVWLNTPVAANLLNLAVVVLLSSFIYGVMISNEGKRIGFIKGLLVCMMNIAAIAFLVIGVSRLMGFPIEMMIRVLFLM